MANTAEAREITKEKLKRYRKDPVLFVREALGVEPTDQQRQLLESVASPGAHVSVKSGHGTGKSTSLAWLVIWHTLLFAPSKAPCTAPSKHQLSDVLWAEIALWVSKLHPYFRDQIEVQTDAVYATGAKDIQFAVARTARKETPDALQGFHAKHLLFVIDEAAGVHEKVFEVARGALSTPSARVIMTANPTQLSGYFYQSHHRNRDRWSRLTFNCEESPLVDPSYWQDIADEYGEDSDYYRVRVKGEFPRASVEQLIPADIVESAMERFPVDESIHRHAPVILGVDVARFGDDRSVIFKRQGLMSWLLWQGRGVDTMALADTVAHHWQAEQAHTCFIDEGAMGAGVIDRLRQLDYAPVGVNFGASSGSPKYKNKRSEMWCLMRDWLKGGAYIPDDLDLRDDLVGPQYQYTPSGQIQLERKKDMKARGLASPDLADALAVTFAYPVRAEADPRSVAPPPQATMRQRRLRR